jgi:hypothetical protein
MKESVSKWRGWVCLLFLFFFAAFLIEAREFANSARTFIEIRKTWLPARALVQETVIATSDRRSSGARIGAVSYITLFTVEAKVRYTIENQTHDAVAFGWEENLKALSRWEARDIRRDGDQWQIRHQTHRIDAD